MRVIIIGANGMLGRDLSDLCTEAGYRVTGFDLPELDITDYPDMRSKLPEADWIINCAAFTRVDDAESERDAAFAVNSEGVRNLARIGLRRLVPVMHLSTDYVFDGKSNRPYNETDRVNPLNIYKASKLAGEKALRSGGGPFLIVRAQSLFGKHGPNFIRTMAKKMMEGDEPLRVVDDQVTAPTYTRHLAEALIELIKVKPDGVVHVAASGSCSWYDLACAIVARLKPEHQVVPIKSHEMQRPAMRPMYSVLNNQRFRELTGHIMPTWQEGLEAYLKEENYFQ